MKKFLTLASLLLLVCACEKKEPIKIYPYNVDARISEDSITPEVYAIAAQRATNKMLDDTEDLYSNNQKPKLFITKTIKNDPSLPDGFFYSQKLTKDIIEGSRTYVIVNNEDDADYVLEISVDRAQANKTIGIEYFLTLYNKENLVVGEWSEILKRTRNSDNSWW